MKEGWICPRCGKVNAPFVGSCDCKPDEMVSNAGSEYGCGGKHQWRLTGGWSTALGNGDCDKCGKISNVAI